MNEHKSIEWGSIFTTVVVVFILLLFVKDCFSDLNISQSASTHNPPVTVSTLSTISTSVIAQTTPINPSLIGSPSLTTQTTKEDSLIIQEPVAKPLDIVKVVKELPVSNEILERHFKWQYGMNDWTWDVSIPGTLYDYYKNIERLPTRNYSVYVTHRLDDLYIDSLVKKIKEAASAKKYDDYQTLELAIVFVQSLPYTLDSVTTPFDEYPRFPVETLVDGGGDCEDTSILLASIISDMGYGVVLLEFKDHMALGIKGGDSIHGSYWDYNGSKYFYLETTDVGWEIGDIPDEYQNSSATIFTMAPVPIITHDWELEESGNFADIKIKIDNLGSASASNVYAFVGFDAGNDKVWSSVSSDPTYLGPGMQAAITLALRPPPQGVHTRLLVQIVVEGVCVDESYSKWIDT
jgi:hypothetical protein